LPLSGVIPIILNKLPSKLEYKNKTLFSTANTEKSVFYVNKFFFFEGKEISPSPEF